MSKVSFRARALDATKPMAVYKACEIPDMKDFAQINRSVPQMPTGMEKEEETEHHLQRALSARQVYGTSDALVIPIPEVQDIEDRYVELYEADFKPAKQYIHIQAFNMDQEIPDYDMDSEDEGWLNEQSKKMEMTPLKFEQMMDRLEKGSGQQVVTLQEAKLLLKEDDDLIMAVYDYWLNKRLKSQRPLIATVKSEKRDGTTTNNPYVAFRRRTEKMQTRKNRKNDESSYEKMLKLKRDLQKALTLLEFIKRREKGKKEHLQLTIEITDKRYEMEDFSGAGLAAAEEEREKHPTFVAPFALNSRGEWVQAGKEETAPARKKRQYRKRKQAQQQQQTQNQSIPHMAVHSFQQQQQQHSGGEVDIMDSSDEDLLSPALSQSDHEDENDPDGMFAFKRRKYCHYNQANSYMGNWPWHGPEEGGRGDKRFRFSLTSLSTGCVGYVRRRIGRGGRVVFDRASTGWNDTLENMDLSGQHPLSGIHSDYITYIRDNKIPHYRPKTPPSDDEQPRSPPHNSSDYVGRGAPFLSGFDVEHFQSHQEQLLEMQREQQQKLLSEEDPSTTAISFDLEHPLSAAEAVSRFTLDSASAEFAVRALVDSPSLETLPTLEGTTPATASADTASAPVGSRTNAQQLSFSLISKSGNASTKLGDSSLNSSLSSNSVVKCVSNVTSGNSGKTINSLSSSGQNSKLDNMRGTKLPIVTGAASLSPSSSVSLLHKSSSASVIPFITSMSESSNPLSSTATILLSHPIKTNGPLTSSHIKSSGLSTSPAANILQLNSPSSSSTSFLHPPSAATSVIVTPVASSTAAPCSSSGPATSSSPTIVAVAPSSSAAISTLPVTSAATAAALQLQRSLNSKLATPGGSAGTLYKLPVAASNANFDIIKSNHEETPIILFSKDRSIPMDVT